MNGEETYADSKGICRRGWHLLSGNHSMVEGAAETGQREDTARSSPGADRTNKGMADSSLSSCESAKARPQAEARMEEGAEAQRGDGQGYAD